MNTSAAAGADRGRLLPIVATAAAVATLLLVSAFAWYLNRDTLPPPPSAFKAPARLAPTYTYNVKSADQDSLVLSGSAGSSDVRVPRPAKVEVMTVSSAAQLKPGDWVNVVAVVDEVRNFSVRMLISIPQHAPVGPDGAGRSAGGFSGLEVRADPAERVVEGGEIVSIEGQKVMLKGPSGDLVITLTPRSPIYRIVPAEPAAVASGDRLVVAEVLTDGSRPAAALAGKLSAAAP